MGSLKNIFRWNPRKKRSLAQRANTASITPTNKTADTDATDKENEDPSQDQAARAAIFEKRFRNEKKKATRKGKAVAKIKGLLGASETSRKATAAENQGLREELQNTKEELAQANMQNTELKKKNHALYMQTSRAPGQKARAVEKALKRGAQEDRTFHIKEKGVITEETRSLVRDLVSIGVPAMHVGRTVKRVAEASGTCLEGDFSSRSVSRICLEGGIASEIQIADEISKASSITISGDGTSHKNTNYESRHANIISETGENHTLFLGISPAVNHTSEEQLAGWRHLVEHVFKLFNEYNKSVDPAAAISDFRIFFELLKGMNTDHAEDQKKLARLLQAMKDAYERERRGEKIVESMDLAEMLPILCQASTNAMTTAGGPDAWNELSEEEQEALNLKAYHDLCTILGKKDYDSMSDTDKRTVDFFVWAGCCMHKELNSVKGGNVRMIAWWAENNITGPIKLMNRDNAAASRIGDSAAKTRAAEVSQAGGVKLTSLAGAIFKHKDDKKGQHDTLRFFFEDSIGYYIGFPDTSNIRSISNSWRSSRTRRRRVH
ncbi:hypothetical protein LshimejAT787_0310830 [Lyophyllum shimeji]|uniref:Uncharacterized protein n=1 Tax=Lyophyllum shimeji TaxID=47721 RepID=A0A9P3PJZ8_LYOSH|nr:hypothetical protein LshimejAT787_0310780 [Lyophyllum shimeji]GLB36796.1 hypothetical protein LshimejAT787_0310830 [Lyophyllum shimeji]